MNANELADAMEIRASIRRKATSRKSVTEGANDRLADQLDQAAIMLRQQQAEIEELEKENTDLRYLIATKLEQQDGISLNSMAHPITNTPEPSYEINPDNLETIEIDLPSPEPVAWMLTLPDGTHDWILDGNGCEGYIPLYTHSAEHDLGVAEAIGFDKGYKAGLRKAQEK